MSTSRKVARAKHTFASVSTTRIRSLLIYSHREDPKLDMPVVCTFASLSTADAAVVTLITHQATCSYLPVGTCHAPPPVHTGREESNCFRYASNLDTLGL